MKRHIEKPTIPACWHRKAPSACLRVELPGGAVQLFPYGNLVTAKHSASAERESIQIHFTSHQIELVGRNLRDLLLALQDFAVKWIRTAPKRYQNLADTDDGVVLEMQVNAIK